MLRWIAITLLWDLWFMLLFTFYTASHCVWSCGCSTMLKLKHAVYDWTHYWSKPRTLYPTKHWWGNDSVAQSDENPKLWWTKILVYKALHNNQVSKEKKKKRNICTYWGCFGVFFLHVFTPSHKQAIYEKAPIIKINRNVDNIILHVHFKNTVKPFKQQQKHNIVAYKESVSILKKTLPHSHIHSTHCMQTICCAQT